MFIGSDPSDMPPTAPKGWEWVRNPGRPCEWTLACNTRDVHWQLESKDKWSDSRERTTENFLARW